jgi:hypothetical protein
MEARCSIVNIGLREERSEIGGGCAQVKERIRCLASMMDGKSLSALRRNRKETHQRGTAERNHTFRHLRRCHFSWMNCQLPNSVFVCFESIPQSKAFSPEITYISFITFRDLSFVRNTKGGIVRRLPVYLSILCIVFDSSQKKSRRVSIFFSFVSRLSAELCINLST